VLGGSRRVPGSDLRVVELLQQQEDVTPGEESNSLLDYFLPRRPGLREGAHAEEVRPREALHLGKLRSEVLRETSDDGLALQDHVSELPVQLDECGVDPALSRELGRLHAPLQIGERRGVVLGECMNLGGHPLRVEGTILESAGRDVSFSR
jgi:hypothetical protein